MNIYEIISFLSQTATDGDAIEFQLTSQKIEPEICLKVRFEDDDSMPCLVTKEKGDNSWEGYVLSEASYFKYLMKNYPSLNKHILLGIDWGVMVLPYDDGESNG